MELKLTFPGRMKEEDQATDASVEFSMSNF